MWARLELHDLLVLGISALLQELLTSIQAVSVSWVLPEVANAMQRKYHSSHLLHAVSSRL